MNHLEATREILWNIRNVWIMYALLIPTAAVMLYGFYRLGRHWRRGKPEARFDQPFLRFKRLFRHAFLQQRTARKTYAGIFHRFLTYGFVVLLIATTVVAIDHDFGTAIMRGNFYLYFQSFTVDVFGALVMVGTGMAAWRRFVKKPKHLVYTDESFWILFAVFVICLTGFLLEGWRIAATNDVWAAWSPFGNLVAIISRPILSVDSLIWAHWATWWFHLVFCFAFFAALPFTKMRHVLTAPLNIFTASLAPSGARHKTINFETTEKFGTNSLADFTWKDLLDLDACTECGRCTEVCPANVVGKELSPRDIILDLRDLMHRQQSSASGEQSAEVKPNTPLIGTFASTAPEALWQCTTCGACLEACPVFIEQMPKIVEMRRFQVMEEADFPDKMQEAVTSLETRGHPFRGTQATRTDWTEGLSVRNISDFEQSELDALEVLLWVGCGGALIERNQKVTRATAELLTQAGVKFAVLGREEKCNGDVARRIGNEFLFAQLAEENVEKLNSYDVKKILTACPHCFNTFKNEYPAFGGHYEVVHHSEFLAELVAAGKIKTANQTDSKIAFHDPCYLGRHNGVFDAPRELVQISSRRKIVELERNKEKSFCCGGGGGLSFIDEPPDKRVNQERAREFLESGAETLAVGCPFCLTMMEDGVNARKGDREIRVLDVAEILLEATKSGEKIVVS